MALSQTGKTPWNKGKTGIYSNKVLQKMRDAAKCRYGDKNPNWKVGLAFIGQEIRKTKDFLTWKKDIFKKDNYTCQKCLKRGGKLHAHHIIPFAICDEERLELSNGATFCPECHYSIHVNEYGMNQRS